MLLERWISLSGWTFAGWILLTWSPSTLNQEPFGAGFAMLVAGLLVGFGDVARPWRLLDPRHLLVLGGLGAMVLVRQGMTIVLWLLGGASVALGVFPNWVVDHVAAPAASCLLGAASYARGVLGDGHSARQLHVAFAYLKPKELLVAGATIVVGLALAHRYLRAAEPAPIRMLRAAHTGSVNDYEPFAVAGLLCVVGVLAVG